MSEPYLHELRVRYAECDPQGIVFNGNYLVYFDVAFTELWREAVGPWSDLSDQGVEAVVAHAELDFRAPARFDDVLTMRCRVANLGRTSITTEIDATRDGELLVAMKLRHVCVSRETWRKTEIPEWVREGLRPFAVHSKL
jgi:acyl-CoA thioester hydrolase